MTELEPAARRILELTREARTPRAEDKARVERLLGSALMLGSTTAHAAAGGTATKLAGSAIAVKWAGIALLALAGGATYFEWRASRPSEAPAATAATAATAPALSAVVSDVKGEAAAPRAPEPPGGAVEHHEPQRSNGARRAHGTLGTLPEELDLLHEAQAKWRAGNAPAALSLLAEHRERFPRSELAPERDALTVLSLCATGETADARRLARRFLRTAPHSPLRTSVEESCGGK